MVIPSNVVTELGWKEKYINEILKSTVGVGRNQRIHSHFKVLDINFDIPFAFYGKVKRPNF